ncbi:MAG: NAD(P)H-hydrate epimerase [Rhodospirillales bacterium]
MIVLCGPGNNGGDGFMIACLLLKACWQLRLMLLSDKNVLLDDCAKAADKWLGPFENQSIESLADRPLVIDAVFGTGITRIITGDALKLLQSINLHILDCVGADIPSGVHGYSG